MAQQLDRAEFRAWLAAMPGDAVAGIETDPWRCPIAAFASQTTGHQPRVHACEWWPDWESKPKTTLATPEWTYAFINAIDRREDDQQPITAAECLRVLGAIPEAQ